jgi:hypothetical protein
MPALVGQYFYSDYCSGWVRSVKLAGGVATEHRQWTGVDASSVTSFGEDAQGELYLCSQKGEVYRLAMKASP